MLVLAVAVQNLVSLDSGEDRAGFTGLVVNSKEDHHGQDQDDQYLEPDTLPEESFFNLSHLFSSLHRFHTQNIRGDFPV